MKYILKDKKPIPEPDLIKWGEWFENRKERIVRQTQISDKIKVSTVFLGIDYRFGEGEPILFETMIFGGNYDEYQERYFTWEEAEKGHEKALKMIYEQN